MDDRVPAVSVVTAFYNRGPLVAESIGSLLDQTLSNIEIIVVDDGSSDNTREELERLSDPRLKVIHQQNSGFVASINRAVRESRAPYVAVHGSGDISLPRRLEAQAGFLDQNPQVGVVGCALVAGDRKIGPANGQAARGRLFDAILGQLSIFSHGEVMFRRALYDAVGGYREFFTFAQDRDLWLRIGRVSGCDYAVLPETLYERRYLSSGVSRNPDNYYLQRKLALFAVQCALAAQEEEKDLIDRFGAPAFFLMRRSRRLSNELAIDGFRWLRDDRVEGARKLFDAAWNEHRNLRSGAGIIASRLSAYGPLRRSMQAVLRLVTPSAHGRSG